MLGSDGSVELRTAWHDDMDLDTTDDVDLDELTTVKLQLTKRQRIRLHYLKILTGETMSSVAREAIAEHLDDRGIEGDLDVDLEGDFEDDEPGER